MKKIINILLIIFLTIILSGCINSQDEVNKAKQNMGIIKGGNNLEKESVEKKIIEKKEAVVEKKIPLEKKVIKKVTIKSLTEEQFLEIDDLSKENLLDGKVEITGRTLANVDKIIVTFSNSSSTFPVDTYTLKQFSSGDDTFLYRAFKKYETIDDGKNVYIFEAFIGNKSSKLEVTLNAIKDEIVVIDKMETDKTKIIYEDIDLSKLPSNSTYGNPRSIGNGAITYSDIKGLEIKRDIITDFTCENITSNLSDRINTWFFWNTCRPIKNNEGISFFVIKLDGDEFVYEKHYYLPYEGLYGIQELERGTGVDSKNIGEKNGEFKLTNSKYDILKVSDELFKEILK